MIVFIILRLFSIIVCAALAANRNRSEMLWAFLGLLLGLLSVIIIACLPSLQCNENKQNNISLSNNLVFAKFIFEFPKQISYKLL